MLTEQNLVSYQIECMVRDCFYDIPSDCFYFLRLGSKADLNWFQEEGRTKPVRNLAKTCFHLYAYKFENNISRFIY